jgi:hypothetical protein
MLTACFGDVDVNWDLGLPCNVEDYKKTPLSNVLTRIYDALVADAPQPDGWPHRLAQFGGGFPKHIERGISLSLFVLRIGDATL